MVKLRALIILLLVSPSFLQANEPVASKSLPAVESVSTEIVDRLSVTTVKLSESPKWGDKLKLEDHGAFLQVMLPGAVVPNPGKFYEGDGNFIKKIALFQFSANEAAVRLFLSVEAKHVKSTMKVDTLDTRVVISLDQGAVSSSVAAATQAKKKEDVAAPVVSAEKSAASMASKYVSPDLRNQLVKVAIFSGILLVLLGVLWSLKPYLRRKRQKAFGDEQPIDMRALDSMVVGAKQKLSLIQIGDEKILIGISPDNISFLTKVDQNPKPYYGADTMYNSQKALEKPSFANFLMNRPDKEEDKQDVQPPVSRKRPIPKSSKPPMKAQEAQAKKDAPAPKRSGAKSQRINIAVGDDGPVNIGRDESQSSKAARSPSRGPENQKAIDDVTHLIREKLKNFKSI